jgi:hypothetical protein
VLEVPERQTFPVERIPVVQRLLKPRLPIGPHGELTWPTLFAQQLHGERSRRSLRHCPTVKRHLTVGVTHLPTQVIAVQPAQVVAGQVAQPQEERTFGFSFRSPLHFKPFLGEFERRKCG